MSAQLRYRTLVRNMGRIYSSPKEGRTDLLQTGLDEICTVIGPATPAGWGVVGNDTERLLHVWVAKEADPAAEVVARQLTDLVRELGSVRMEASAPVPFVLESPPSAIAVAPPSSPVLPPVPPPIAAPPSIQVVEAPAPAPADVIQHIEEEIEIEEEISVAPSENAGEVETIEVEDEELVVEEEAEEEEVVEEEVVEEEVVEEEGMEVETIHIRGRRYWLEINTKKIYAVQDEDDVGDEVGEMVDGKPRFYTK